MAELDELRATIDEILDGSRLVMGELNPEQVLKFFELLSKTKHIFVVGAGRSGLIAKAFAIKLAHLGLDVNVVGETVLVHPESGDLLIAVSSSGETTFTVRAASIAKRLGTKVVALTASPESTLGREADIVIKLAGGGELVRGTNVEQQFTGEYEPLSPANTLFEIASMIFLNCIVMRLRQRLGKQSAGG